MKQHIIKGFVILAGLMFFAGCSGTLNNVTARNLSGSEYEKIMESGKHHAFNDAGEMKPESIDPKELMKSGDMELAGGNDFLALYHYTRALSVIKSDKEKYTLKIKMAGIYLKESEWGQAREIFAELSEKWVYAPQAWEGLGIAELALGNIEAAEKALEEAYRLDNNRWKVNNALGIIANMNGRPRDALGYFDEAVTRNPNHTEIYNNIGLSHLMIGDYGKAEKSFMTAITMDNENKKALNNLGIVHMRQNRIESALHFFEKAEGRAKALYNIGCYLAWNKDYRKAGDFFRMAVEASPQYYASAAKQMELMEIMEGSASK